MQWRSVLTSGVQPTIISLTTFIIDINLSVRNIFSSAHDYIAEITDTAPADF